MEGMPTRIAIGTQKAASTYLYNLLASHPEVSLSEHTEINFYSSNFEKGTNWYCDTFKTSDTRIDISPKYFMWGDAVAPRIKKTLGNEHPKFLLILRNPIDYTNSHFSMQWQQRFFERSSDYQNPPRDLPTFIEQYPKYAERGLYHNILTKHWLEHFPLSDFKIVFFEELVGKDTSEQVLHEIQEFWGITPHTLTASIASKNRALRSPFLHKLKHKVISRPRLKEFLKSQSWFQYFYQHVLTTNSSDTLSKSDRLKITLIYKSDVQQLETLLGRKTPWSDFTK